MESNMVSETNIWYPIKDFEGLYEITMQGEVRSVDRKFTYYDPRWNTYTTRHTKSKIMNQYDSIGGYKFISLRKDGKYYQCYVHRLVAQTFIPNPENKKEVNHKDGNKCNNAATNLEWVTPSENQIHSHQVLGHPSSTKGTHLSEDRRRKLSVALRGKPSYIRTAETRAKFIKTRYNPVRCITDGKMFACAKDADRYYGYNGTVAKNIKLNRATRDGKWFEYMSKEEYYAVPL